MSDIELEARVKKLEEDVKKTAEILEKSVANTRTLMEIFTRWIAR